MVTQVQQRHDFMLSANINYRYPLHTDTELQLFRIIQEAVTNMLKHAHASAGNISINQLHNTVTVIIKDNGQGFDADNEINGKRSFGLLNILERARAINGKVQFVSGVQGTTITIIITNPTEACGL